MPIQFSIGFVLEGVSPRQTATVCAASVDDVHVKSLYVNVVKVSAYWPRGVSCK